MSGRFMNIKRIVIPTITMVIIASQLMGCAAVSQSELLQMINQGDAIEIEVATPINQEQGTESAIDWQELASLSTNDTLRDSWDDILMITPTDTGKNGVLYVDVEGNNEPNNTLRVALHNSEFLKYLDSEADSLKLSNAVQGNYADLDDTTTTKALYMGINGYFNLLPDSSPNYANPDATLQRNEFMAMVFRAETPVQDLTPDTTFADAVGQSDYNIYAQGVAGNSYLDTASKSLNNLTANGTITRAEALYLLVSRYFSDDMASVDVKGTTFSDAKDGGDIAGEQEFIEDAKEKDYWKSYELAYVVQNPDGGLPTDLYKALVVAKSKGLITDTTRWDEALTKSEAIEFLVKTLRQEKGIEQFNAKQGLVAGHEVHEETTESEQTETVEGLEDGINSTHTDVELGEDEYKGDTGVDALNAQYNDLSPEKKAEVDAALERAKKKHPEWFTDDSAGNTNTGEGNYEHVGTPSTGELPTFEFGQGDYSAGAGAQVY